MDSYEFAENVVRHVIGYHSNIGGETMDDACIEIEMRESEATQLCDSKQVEDAQFESADGIIKVDALVPIADGTSPLTVIEKFIITGKQSSLHFDQEELVDGTIASEFDTSTAFNGIDSDDRVVPQNVDYSVNWNTELENDDRGNEELHECKTIVDGSTASTLIDMSLNEINSSAETSVEALAFKVSEIPSVLDGSLAGDEGFDPLGFSKSKNTLYWMREAEVKHARIAMLAAVGWPISELWHREIAELFNLQSILAGPNGDRAPSVLNGGLSNVWATGMLIMSIIIAGYLETKAMNRGEVFWGNEKSEGYVPGSLGFDPLNLYNLRNSKKSMELAEIKNGRLAMIAIAVYILQEIITGAPIV
jgi:hypothetical protein